MSPPRRARIHSLSACSSSSPDAPADASPSPDAGDDASFTANDASVANNDASSPADIHGKRYCEVLAAKVNGSQVHVDVYNSFGLNDCPDAAWTALDPTALASQLGVTQVILNGPRYWTLDAFLKGDFIDPTSKTLGGIDMRLAGAIDMPFTPGATVSTPYALHQIQRNTIVSFRAGTEVYELVDPQGKIYDMQSFSTQKAAQTEADLASLASKLTLPSGWSFRARLLTHDLTVAAVGGMATVTQDDFANTYQQSQQ